MDKFRCVLLSLIQLMGICCNVSAREVPYGEAVYLHLDNDGYFLGETLHFAANVVNTADCKAEVKSRVLYVDFVAPEGYVLSTGKYRIDDGRCDGEIALPPLWLSGLYEIRAYTRYMMKADSRDYFTRVVPVYDASHGGDYSLRGILSRRREVHSDSASTVQPLLRTATETKMSGKLYVSYDTAQLKPNGLVKISLKGVPHSRLSLSVTDARGHIGVNKIGDISDFMASVHSGKPAKTLGWVAPEAELTAYGTVTAERKAFLKSPLPVPQAGVKVASVLYGAADTLYDATVTDSLGRFHFGFGDSGGTLLIRCDASDGKPLSVTMDKWFAPKPRAYTTDETGMLSMGGGAGVSYVTEAPLKLKSGYSNGITHSCVHTTVLDEVEWMRAFVARDFGFRRAGMKNGETANLIFGMLRHWGYPSNLPIRIISVDGKYPADGAVPKARRVYDGFDFDIESYGDIVIHTDSAIRNAYGYDEVPQYVHMAGSGGGTGSARVRHVGINVRGNYPYGEPAIVICLMPMNGDKARGVASCLASDYVYTRVAGFADGSKHEVPDYCRIREPEQGGDNRRLLYWNPTVTLDERGEATVEFRNNSSCRQVVVSAEGLTNDGRAVTNR